MPAGKIGKFDSMNGAFFSTFSAVHAFIVVNNGKIVHKRNRAMLTVSNAEAASDTARGAFRAYDCALLVI